MDMINISTFLKKMIFNYLEKNGPEKGKAFFIINHEFYVLTFTIQNLAPYCPKQIDNSYEKYVTHIIEKFLVNYYANGHKNRTIIPFNFSENLTYNIKIIALKSTAQNTYIMQEDKERIAEEKALKNWSIKILRHLKENPKGLTISELTHKTRGITNKDYRKEILQRLINEKKITFSVSKKNKNKKTYRLA